MTRKPRITEECSTGVPPVTDPSRGPAAIPQVPGTAPASGAVGRAPASDLFIHQPTAAKFLYLAREARASAPEGGHAPRDLGGPAAIKEKGARASRPCEAIVGKGHRWETAPCAYTGETPMPHSTRLDRSDAPSLDPRLSILDSSAPSVLRHQLSAIGRFAASPSSTPRASFFQGNCIPPSVTPPAEGMQSS
jgi:hypothetical protein